MQYKIKGVLCVKNIYEFLEMKHNLKVNGQLFFKHFKRKKYYFVVDIESDGLYGEGFCVSAIVVDIRSGKMIDKFIGIAESNKVTSEWVKKEALPHLRNIKDYGTKDNLRKEFWSFYESYRKDSIILTDSGSPVEAYWFRQCVMDNHSEREYLGPFPMHDVATAVLLSGVGNVTRLEYAGLTEYPQHHPYYDCLASLITFIKCTEPLVKYMCEYYD